MGHFEAVFKKLGPDARLLFCLHHLRRAGESEPILTCHPTEILDWDRDRYAKAMNEVVNGLGYLLLSADVLPERREPSVFRPPSLDEVRDYCREKGYGIDPEEFVTFYETRGWKAGRFQMKSWKSALALWERRRKQKADGFIAKQAKLDAALQQDASRPGDGKD